jgi:voltage-gated potassium channel
MPSEPSEAERAAAEALDPFQLVVLVLSVYVLVAMLVEGLVTLPPETSRLLAQIDVLVCGVFLTDFFVRLYRAPRKLAFLRWGWFDLVSSIPMVDSLRWVRVVRLLRILRILRAVRSARVVLGFIFRSRIRGTFASVALGMVVIVITSSIAILHAERHAGEPNIKTGGDALWWSVSTMTTVGYGDRYPVTPEGRLIAATVMVAGCGVFGLFTAGVASLFLQEAEKQEKAHFELVLSELKRIEEKVDALARDPGRDHQP